ncbi:VRR-NUC domain-containing protein [Kribbella qitaiheensis]|uniref:VRR-NUC domain-containing protein n=1 Tax=Kribbella qitaiheensis TaxID=1544730 RepID=A0A7G6WVU7_9ACTN|nr:VRR-NUC domain-containing protein [Kribbella qitaiheensis]QNE18112.1 VRR-NUC domain-containing protein [Kribbella qitaiheensis]
MERRERDIEQYFRNECRKRGFLCLKFVSPSRNGVPDRVVVTPAATVFVELKKPGSSLRKIQRVTHSKLRRHGAAVYVVDGRRSADRLLAELSDGRRPVAEPNDHETF